MTAKKWPKEEAAFICKHLKKECRIADIVKMFNEKFEPRTYDSIQKKAQKLANIKPEDAAQLQNETPSVSPEKQEIMDIYIDILKKKGRRPYISELEERKISRSKLRHHWGKLRKLELAARAVHKDFFNEVRLSDIFTPASQRRLLSTVKGCKRFVITTAVAGCRVDQDFLASIDTYCNKNDAELLVMIAADPAHQWAHDDELGNVDVLLQDRHLIMEELAINDKLYLSSIKLSAKQIDPVTGMESLAQLDSCSYIFASPKQRMKFVPVPEGKHPPAIMGTGAITKPNYRTDMYMSRRTGYMAEKSHIMGAIIIEIENRKAFHFRQVQADIDGSFIDWGIKYTGKGTSKAPVEALVCGDLHAGREEPKVVKGRAKLIEELKPLRIVLHDLFDGRSITHHDEGKSITKARRARDENDSLDKEFEHTARALEEFTKVCDEVVVIKSNHDEHLTRYLEDGRFVDDPKNYRAALTLAACVYDGEDPIQAGSELAAKKKFKNVVWLQRDEEYTVAGIDLSHHGDRGPNGSRGSVRSFARSVRASITGHSHTAEIHGTAWRVGTSTSKLDYCIGPSSWTNTDCLLYDNGARQLVHYINGKFKA